MRKRKHKAPTTEYYRQFCRKTGAGDHHCRRVDFDHISIILAHNKFFEDRGRIFVQSAGDRSKSAYGRKLPEYFRKRSDLAEFHEYRDRCGRIYADLCCFRKYGSLRGGKRKHRKPG